MYTATILKIKNVRPHPNADRVLLATCHGNQVVVGLNTKEGDLGVYFPSDGQLSHEFCHANDLYRKTDLNRDSKAKPGMFDDNRRVRAQKFRGEVSDGFWTPIENLAKVVPVKTLEEGFEFTDVNGVNICGKYINPATLKGAQTQGAKKTRTARTSVMFKEHFDTDHFGKNLFAFRPHHEIVLSEKIHGTSHRVGHVQVDRKLTWIEKLLSKFGVAIQTTEWAYLNGTRRVVLEEKKKSDGSYHDPSIREKAFRVFDGNLRKGETVYLEIVGWESETTPIMPRCGIDKKALPEVHKAFGDEMVYRYGCTPGSCDFYVYRMTMTSVDGDSYDYPWDEVVKRCEEIGVKHVPELTRVSVSELIDETSEVPFETQLLEAVDKTAKGPSVLDASHIREGVVVRINNVPGNKSYKHKSFEFKVLEGIIKDAGIVDTEEVQSELV